MIEESGLDSASDKRIRQTIRKESGEKTIIAVANRLISIVDADYVVVVEAGRPV